jgi:CheY-like chemotaxis protein
MDELPPILVAEDSDDDFFFLRRAVRLAGIENALLRFRDGSELVKFLEGIPAREIGPQQDQPWLLLVDITMPIMNGFELLQWLGKAKDIPKLRPVILSGSYREEDVARGKSLGAVDYLVKPVTPAAALAAVNGTAVSVAGLSHA